MTDGNTKTLLVITAHPADAFDLAGGTIALHRQRGDQVHVASVTHGARSHAPSIYDDKQEALDEAAEARLLQEIIQEKKQEFEAAARAVDATATHFLGEDDEPFVATRSTILRLAELYRTVRPDILITHHRTEQNHHDHPAVGDVSVRALVTAARWLEGSRLEPYDVPTVYYYGTQDRRDVRINRGTVWVSSGHPHHGHRECGGAGAEEFGRRSRPSPPQKIPGQRLLHTRVPKAVNNRRLDERRGTGDSPDRVRTVQRPDDSASAGAVTPCAQLKSSSPAGPTSS